MENNPNLPVFLFLVIAVMAFFCILMFYKYRQQVRVTNRIRYENICSTLRLNGHPTRLEYTQLWEYWRIYKKETDDKFSFINLASSVITAQVKGYKTFEEIVCHLKSFDFVIENAKKSSEEKEFIKSIHREVAHATVSKVMTVAQARCHYLRALPNTKDRGEKFFRFKEELSLVAFSFFPHATYEFFLDKEKQKFKKKKIPSS